MKNSTLFLAFACLLLPLLAWGQGKPSQSNYPFAGMFQAGPPSGNCAGLNILDENTSNGNLYTCPVPGSAWVLAGGGGSSSFAGLTSGTNTTATLICGTGCIIEPSGSGVIQATSGGGGIPINGTPVALPGAVTSFNLFGDSITAGAGIQYATQGYGYLTAAALGEPIANDFGVAGYDIQQITRAAYGTTPTPALASMSILGANDIAAVNVSYTLAQYTLQQQAYAVYMAAPTDQLVLTSGMTFVGSWSSNAQGLTLRYSTGSTTDTATATVSGTTVYVGTYVFGGLTTSFTIKIDGVLVDTQSLSIAGAPVYLCYRYSGLSSGSHTVVMTANNSSNYAVISFVAGNGGTQLPFELIGNTIQFSGMSNVVIGQMNSALATMVSNLESDGLQVYVANSNAAVNYTATPPEYVSTTPHPNALGNLLIANAFLNTVYASNAVAQLNAQFIASELQAVLALPATPISTTAIPTSNTGCNAGYAALDSSSFLDVCVGNATWLSIPLQAFHTAPNWVTSSTLTSGVIPQATGAGAIGNSSPQLDNGVTTPNTLTYAGSGGIATPIVNAATGYQIGSAAPSAHYPRGNGTNYVDGTIQAGDLPGGSIASTVSNSDSTLTISPTSGSVVASLNLGHANTWTAAQTFNLPPIIGSVGGTGGSIQHLGTTSGQVQPGCVPATTCTAYGSGSAPSSFTKYNTTTNCGANGTAANPSVVSCGSAGAGSISCSASASAGTCTVNDTAVTANSNIILTSATYIGTRLAVTCNTAVITGDFVSAVSAGTSFTITLPVFTTNPECFTYQILN